MLHGDFGKLFARFTVAMNPLDLVKLSPLMALTIGRPEVVVGLIDGPIALGHPALEGANIRILSSNVAGACTHPTSPACFHGTFVAGILCAKRGGAAPAICPSCTLLVRPIFPERLSENVAMPSATPDELGRAIIDCIEAGAHVLNLSLGLAPSSTKAERALEAALDLAAARGVITVAAAGNQGLLASSSLTRHAWVIPVAACDLAGKPLVQSNLGISIGRRGLSAPGDNVVSLTTTGHSNRVSGTSAAAPFVTGAVALLKSAFPFATPTQVKLALTQRYLRNRTAVVPPVMDAWAAYRHIQEAHVTARR
jgi:subtilisin family serine protease